MKQSSLKRKTELRPKKPLTAKKPWQKKRTKTARAKDFPDTVKRIVFERSGGKCERCKIRSLQEYHHCIFRSAGKSCTNELSNCLGLCIWCHKEAPDSAHKSKETRLWCVREAKRLAEQSA